MWRMWCSRLFSCTCEMRAQRGAQFSRTGTTNTPSRRRPSPHSSKSCRGTSAASSSVPGEASRKTSTILLTAYSDRTDGRSNISLPAAAPAAAPMSCATTKAATSSGAIPAKLLVKLRTSVIAGLAKLVDEVNQ